MNQLMNLLALLMIGEQTNTDNAQLNGYLAGSTIVDIKDLAEEGFVNGEFDVITGAVDAPVTVTIKCTPAQQAQLGKLVSALDALPNKFDKILLTKTNRVNVDKKAYILDTAFAAKLDVVQDTPEDDKKITNEIEQVTTASVNKAMIVLQSDITNGTAKSAEERQFAGLIKGIVVNPFKNLNGEYAVKKSKGGKSTYLDVTFIMDVPQLATVRAGDGSLVLEAGAKTIVRRVQNTNMVLGMITDESNEALRDALGDKGLASLIAVCKNAAQGKKITEKMSFALNHNKLDGRTQAVHAMCDFDINTAFGSYYSSNDAGIFEYASKISGASAVMFGRTPDTAVYHRKNGVVFSQMHILDVLDGKTKFVDALEAVKAFKAQAGKRAEKEQETADNMKLEAFKTDEAIRLSKATKVNAMDLIAQVTAMTPEQIAQAQALGLDMTAIINAQITQG